MVGRGLFFGGLLMAAAGLPYVSSSTPEPPTAQEEQPTRDTGLEAGFEIGREGLQRVGSADVSDPQSADQLPVVDITEALRFDIQPGWVVSRWPRVSTGLATLELSGYRVAWISGTAADDVAGSLTYYFDTTQQVNQIKVQGTTENPAKLIAFMASVFSFQPAATTEPGVSLYHVRWNGRAESELEVRATGKGGRSTASSSYRIDLTLANPATR